jgi:drug/metabolite transporter (DMT)-like permease
VNWGEIFALTSAATWALAVILLRRSGETLPPFELNLFKNSLGFLLMIPTIMIFDGIRISEFSHMDVLIAIASGALGIALADTLYLKGLNMMGASRTGIVASLFSPFVILLSTIFLGERMHVWQWLGFFLVIAGVMLVTWRVNRAEVDSADVKKGSIYGAAAMFMMAVGIVMVKDLLETKPFLWTFELRMVGGVGGLLLFMLLSGRWQRVKHNFRQPQPWGTIVLASFLAAYLSLMLWLAGYKLIDASLASALNETNGAFIVLLAWLMLGETLTRRKLTGISLTLTGVIIMIGLS